MRFASKARNWSSATSGSRWTGSGRIAGRRGGQGGGGHGGRRRGGPRTATEPKSSSPAGSTCRPIASAPLPGASFCTPPGRPASTSPRRRASPARRKSSGWSGRLGPTDLCLCLISGGGSALLPAPRGHLPGRQAGPDAAPQRRRGRHRRTQHRPEATQPDQGGRAGPGVPRRAAGGAGHFRRAGRSAGPDRLRPDRALTASTPRGAPGRARTYAAAGRAFRPRVVRLSCGEKASRPAAAADVPGRRISSSATTPPRSMPPGRRPSRWATATRWSPRPQSEGPAEDVGRHLAAMALRMRSGPGPDCLISGGEPVVRLVEASRRGLGGRNQQLVLAALEPLAADGARGHRAAFRRHRRRRRPDRRRRGHSRRRRSSQAAAPPRPRSGRLPGPQRRLSLFRAHRRLVKTGPTDTNVGDVRVVVVGAMARHDRTAYNWTFANRQEACEESPSPPERAGVREAGGDSALRFQIPVQLPLATTLSRRA